MYQAMTRPDSTSKRSKRRLAKALVILTCLALGMWAAMSALYAPAPTYTKTVTYTVRQGQTLWDIALQVDDTRDTREVVDDIQKLNGLGSAEIYPGQVLKVPAEGGK